MNVVNLTPHELHLFNEDGFVRTIQPDGRVARVRQDWSEKGSLGSIPVFGVEPTEAENLPDPQHDTIYVVSTQLEATLDRPDVYSPGRLKRDQDGQVYGCLGLKQTEGQYVGS